MATEDAKPESSPVTEQDTAGEQVHSDASGLLQADKFPREETKHEESLPENPMNDREEHTKVSNATAVTKIDSEVLLHSDVDVLDETKTKTSEFSEMVSIEGDSISPDDAVSNKHDDSEQSTVEPEENHAENLHQKPTDYAHVSLLLEQASPEEESPIQEPVIVKHVEEDLHQNARDTTEESTLHEDKGAPKEENSEVQKTDDDNNVPEKVEEDKPNQDLTSNTDETYMDSGTVYNQNIKEESINQEAEIGNLPPEDISPPTLTVEEPHGIVEEGAKPASTEGNGSLQEFQSDAQTDEAASEDAREVLEASIPAASEETKEYLAFITNVVPQVPEVNSRDEKVIEKENETVDAMPLGASDISQHEEPQKAIESEDKDYEKYIPELASNDKKTKQEQGDKKSIIDTAKNCESEAEIESQDHGIQTVDHHNVDQPLEDSSKDVTSLDLECRSTEAVSETNVAEVSSAEALVDFPEEMPSVKIPNQEETTQTSSEGKSEGTDAEGNIVSEATEASFTTSLEEELLQNEGNEPAESNISGSPRKEIAGESKADDDPLEGKSEKTEESPIEKKTEDAEIINGEHLADEQNQQATVPLSIEDRNCKSQEDIPASQDLSEAEERDIEDAEDSSCDVPEQELSRENFRTDEQKQEAGPNADALHTVNQSKEPETEDSQRLNTEVEIQEDAVKCNAVEERDIPDDALLSHEDSELKVVDTSDEMDNVSPTTKLEDTEQVEPNQDLTSSTNENSKEEFINQEAEKGNLPPEEINRDISPSNLTVEEPHGNVEESAKPALTEGNESLQEFESDAQTDIWKLLEVSTPAVSEETKESKEDIAYITNVVPHVTEENSTDQEVIEKENDIIDGDDALLRKPEKEDISQHEEPQNAIKSEDIYCEESIPVLALNDQTTKQEQGDKESIVETTEKCAAGETKSEAEIELQDHAKDVISDLEVQTVEHHNVDQPLDDPLEGKSEKIEESSIEKKTEDPEITGGEELADEQRQQATEPLSKIDLSEESEIHITAKDNDIDGKSSAEDSSFDFPEQELSLETCQKDEPKQEAGPNAEVLQTFNQSKEPETTEDTQSLNTEVEIQDKDVNIEEAVKSCSVEEKYIPDEALVSELKVDDVSDVIIDNVSQTTKLEDAEKTIDSIPAEEGKVDDHDRNLTKEGDLKSEEYPGSIQDEMPETINSESKIVKVVTAEKNINNTSPEVEVEEEDLRSEEFTGETKAETVEEPRQVLTSDEIGDYSPAKEEGTDIIDTTVIDELNQKVLEPQTTYDTDSFRREMQGGENVVEELPELSTTEEIVYQAVERKEERTANDATVLDDEYHQEGIVNEISSAHNSSIENIKLEEGMTTEAAWIQTVEEDSNVHQINDTAEIRKSMESEATKLEEHKLTDVTQGVGEKAEDSSLESPSKSPIVEEVIADKEESIAEVDEMNFELKSEDTRSNVDEMPENIVNTDENTEEEPVKLLTKLHEDENDSITEIQNDEAVFPESESREVTNQIDSSSTKIEEKDDLAVLQDPAPVHTPIESSTPVSDVEKEEEMTVIHPKDGEESLEPEVEPEAEVITEEVSIIMQDSSSKEHKTEENFQEQGNMSTQARVTKLNEEEKDRDQDEYEPTLTTGHDSAREAEAIEESTSEETIEEPRRVSTSEETGDYSPAKEEPININDTTVIEELNQKVLEPGIIDSTESSTRQMHGEENVVEEIPQLSNTEDDSEFHQENMVNEISANNKITENIKLEEGITTEIEHEERTVEVPSQDSSLNKVLSQDLSEKEHNEGALNDTAIDESNIEGSLDFHHINDTAEIPSVESEATKFEEHKVNDATQSVGENDLPAEDSPIVEKVIIYNPDVKDSEESIAKVDEINSESKSEETTVEVESETNLITNEGLSPDSEDREATNNVCDSNMEIEEKGVPDPQTDAIIFRDIQVPSESPIAESNSGIIEEMEHEDASKTVSNTVNTISKECNLNEEDKEEKVEEPVELSDPTSVRNLHEHENDSTTEIQNEQYFLNKIPTEATNQIDNSSTKIEEKDDLEAVQDLAAVHEPFESSTPVSDVDNLNKEGEEVTIFHPDGDESLQPKVEKRKLEDEVQTKEASIIVQDSSSKEQESEAVKISDADQDMEITATEDPKTGIDTKIASEDKLMSILDKSQAGETFQTETENLKPENTSNVVPHAVSSSIPETSFKDDKMGADAKKQVRSSDQESVINENKEASEVENELSLNNRPTDEMLSGGKVPEMLPETQHGEEAKESMTSLEDLLQTSRNGNIKSAENEPTILENDSKPYSYEDKAEEDTKGEAASDSPVLVEASRDFEVKTTPKKTNNILSGVGSKVKNSIAKVKKVITGKSSSPK